MIENSLRCLHWFYDVRGYLAEGAITFHEAVARLRIFGSTGPLHIQLTGHFLAIESWFAFRLGHNLLALGQYEQGESHLRRAMQIARQSQLAPRMLDALVGWGIIQALDGEVELAADILAGIARHPAGTQSIRERVCLALTDLGYSLEVQQQ